MATQCTLAVPVSSLLTHGRILGLSLALIAVLGFHAAWSRGRQEPLIPIVAVEHTFPLSLTLRLSMGGSTRLIDLKSDHSEALLISVPADWKRTEVRGAALQSVTAEPPALGYIRWRLPGRASVTFRTEGTWRRIAVNNPSGVPLTLRLTAVDLERETAEHDVIIVKDEPALVP